ncbi:hypothetical protein C7I84_10875 [Mesorhizobium ephedrae]|uniref:Phenol degradation protein meta n=1 Tax=Kumtagia ephedrae TaxID=2116701 RepID=A0A2P7SD92_9HYPH|nr:hypothetical protein C7I84_10875 [Mesorhizobium ephedrae]
MRSGRSTRLLAATAFLAAIAGAGRAEATEAVAGRYIPGAFAGPGMGIVPPVPGAYWAIENVYYHGEAGADVPFGDNSVAVGLSADIWITALAGVYVPGIDLPGNWTYAVQGILPIGWTGADAVVGPFAAHEEMAGIGDIAIAPILLGWHDDALNTFFSTSLTVTAPTGRWEDGALAFVGLNYWTFTPAVAFTRLFPEHGLDFSANLGIDINTKNTDTDYYSGALAHLDLALTKKVTENLSVGAIAGFLYQVEGDDSDFADAHDGFKGRSVAVGPLVQYKAKFSETTEFDLIFKWSHELDVKNRMKGDALVFQISGKF